MQIREYLSVRRAFNLVRRSTDKASRLTFEEFSILCHLHYADGPLRTSDIAEYQHVLRPTMTHRTNRLERLAFIQRFAGESDRRTVCCSMTEAGEQYISRVAQSCATNIPAGMALNRPSYPAFGLHTNGEKAIAMQQPDGNMTLDLVVDHVDETTDSEGLTDCCIETARAARARVWCASRTRELRRRVRLGGR